MGTPFKMGYVRIGEARITRNATRSACREVDTVEVAEPRGKNDQGWISESRLDWNVTRYSPYTNSNLIMLKW